jgi:hypothetical protein
VDEKSDKKSGHELFFSARFSTSPRCDCRLEKLEIIDFVCWIFFGDMDHLGIHQALRATTTRDDPCQDFYFSFFEAQTFIAWRIFFASLPGILITNRT